MTIRKFKETDALFCFQIRCDAFLNKFIDEIGGKAVRACIEAYMPQDYIGMSEEMEFFVVEENEKRVGFVTLKKNNESTAEIPLIYFDLSELNKGYGSKTINYIEDWIKENWKDIKTLYLDTVIPKYNGGFYSKMGFKKAGKSVCSFPGMDLPAVRFEKNI